MGCLEFPSLPPVKPPAPEQDQDLYVSARDVTPLIDLAAIDAEVSRDHSMDMLTDVDLEVGIDFMLELDMNIPVDASVEPENFTIVQCVNGYLEGSERRVIDGQEQTLDPLPCRLEGERWLRVDPVGELPFSTPNEILPIREVGLIDVNVTYTFFFMARETSYDDYAARCDAASLTADPMTRIQSATCRSPEVLSMSNEDCAHQTQERLNAAVMNNEVAAPPEGESYQLPMTCVAWEDAAQYCRRIGGRLPSDVEWEVAATYGRQVFPKPWPMTLLFGQELCDYVHISGDGPTRCSLLHPLQLSKIRPTCWGDKNPWVGAEPSYELCDTSGNAAEWVLDDMSEQRPESSPRDGAPYLTADPHLCPAEGEGEGIKVTRGGNSEVYRPTDIQNVYLTAYRGGACSGVDAVTGFRCVISDQTHGVEPWSESSQ